jgi:hypothetical protein
MKKIREFLAGYKTYIVAVGIIATSVERFSAEAISFEAMIAAIAGAVVACTVGAKIDRAAK